MTIDTNSWAFVEAWSAYGDVVAEGSNVRGMELALEAWERNKPPPEPQWRPIAEAKAFSGQRVVVGGQYDDDPHKHGPLTWLECDVIGSDGRVSSGNRDAQYFCVIPPFPTPPTKGVE